MRNIDIAPERYARHPNHPLARALALGLGGLLAIYLVGRGIAEFFIVHYADPASYRNDWGGRSLAGVFAVHSGPAVAILIGAGVYARRRWRGRSLPDHPLHHARVRDAGGLPGLPVERGS